MKKAFTLVELLIVIAIIGVLAGILMSSFSGGTESARAAKCLNNMRSLAQGAISYSVTTRAKEFPLLAGSKALILYGGSGKYYKEQPGWISWLSNDDQYGTRTKGKSYAKSYVSLQNVGAYSEKIEEVDFAIQNGTIWQSMGGNRDAYVCPQHRIAAQKKGATVNFSYVMNCYFGYNPDDKGYKSSGSRSLTDSSVRRERRLMFAELPIYGSGTPIDEGGTVEKAEYPTDNSTEVDCVLQTKVDSSVASATTFWKGWSGSDEMIAFNHKSNKKYCAHVVFADGHAEKFLRPKSASEKKNLTQYLCAAKDIGFDGTTYKVLNNNDKND